MSSSPAAASRASPRPRASRALGLAVVLVDDGLELGGALACTPARAAELFAASPLVGVEILSRAVVAGFYEGELLIVTAQGEAILVRPRATVFATGAHDGVMAVPGNDLPGVLSARALCRLIHAGIVPDGPTAIVGGGFWADELSLALGDAPALRLAPEALVDVRGTGGVRAIGAREGGTLAVHEVAVVALALPGAPAFELAAQAGAELRFDPALGYVVVTSERGRAAGATAVWAAGECAGKAFDPGGAARRGGARRGGRGGGAVAKLE